MTDDSRRTAGADGASQRPAIDQVAEALAQLRYGAIQLTIHDGKLVQLDITERRRFPN